MSRRFWIIFSFIVIIMIVGGMLGSLAYFSDSENSDTNTTRASNNWTSWFDYASTKVFWSYRKPISITNSGGSSLTNYQVKLNINYVSGMQEDFDDLRFTSSNGTTSLDYWVESSDPGISAVVWVEVNSIAASPNITTIYMYYGNSAATDGSNGFNTFLLFDDFEDGLTSRWTDAASYGTKTAPTAPDAPHGNRVLYLDDNDTGSSRNYGVYKNFSSSNTCVVEYYAKPAQINGNWEMRVNSNTTIGPLLRFNNSSYIDRYTTSWTNLLSYGTSNYYNFQLDKILTATATDTYDTNIDGTAYGNSRFRSNQNVTSLNRLYFVTTTNGQAPDLYIDLVKVRQYTTFTIGTNEPDFGTQEE